jgi:Domain of unknown function (DUF222)
MLSGMHSEARDGAGLGGEPATPASLVGPDGPAVVRTEADQVSAALRELAGQIHAANAELVGLLSRFDALGGWHGIGIRSLGHWASIHLGIDVRTAAQQTQIGRRLAALPTIAAAAAAGELGWSKLQLVARVADPASEAKWLGLAREMAVGQLARVVSAYRRASETDDPDRCRNHRDRRGVWLFDQPDGLVRITGLLEADDAAVLRAALAAQVELLWRNRDDDTAAAETNGPETDGPQTSAHFAGDETTGVEPADATTDTVAEADSSRTDESGANSAAAPAAPPAETRTTTPPPATKRGHRRSNPPSRTGPRSARLMRSVRSAVTPTPMIGRQPTPRPRRCGLPRSTPPWRPPIPRRPGGSTPSSPWPAPRWPPVAGPTTATTSPGSSSASTSTY